LVSSSSAGASALRADEVGRGDMNTIIKTWLTRNTTARFTAHSLHTMDELFIGASIFSERSLRQSVQSLIPKPIIIKAEALARAAAFSAPTSASAEIVIASDNIPDDLPTPTDVPVPEPWDVPVPEPIDVPPPTPHDVPPPEPTDPQPRPIP
jgi:hypothetical protein